MQTCVENLDFNLAIDFKLKFTTFYKEIMIHCKIYLFLKILIKNKMNKHIQIKVLCEQHHEVCIKLASDYLV